MMSRNAPPGTVSVIIPAFDAVEVLGEQLDALARQTYRGDWEIVIADNGSTDGTSELARSYRAVLPQLILVDASDRRGPGHARNVGASAARGDLLLFTDADDVVSASWIEAMVLAASKLDIVRGTSTELPESASDTVPSTLSPAPGEARAWLARNGWLPFSGTDNVAIWRDVHDAIGGFDEEFRTAEDQDYSWRTQLAGGYLGYSTAHVYHRPRRSILDVFRQWYGYGHGNVKMYVKYRQHGARRRDLRTAVKTWSWILVRCPRAVRSRTLRAELARLAGKSLGRVVGSVQEGVWFP